MMQTICDLWNGKLAPCEYCGADDERAIALARQRAVYKEKLSAVLTEAQREIFLKFLDGEEDYLFRMMELAFAEGFCPGSKLVFESLN